MKPVRYSRHARRRMKLYDIPIDAINNCLQNPFNEGRQVIINPIVGFIFLLK
jgi:hypothetical protein